MKTLWLFTRTPNIENQRLLKRLIDENDALIFVQNGVYFAKNDITLDCKIYFLKTDLQARGLKTDMPQIDYADLIDLFFKFERIATI